MISLSDYFGPYHNHPDATTQRREAADDLLAKVNALLLEAEADGSYGWLVNPNTGSCISGKTNGGFRPHDCPEGAPSSSHKQGRGIDIYDPAQSLDDWITDEMLAKHGLYREAPESTHNWAHLTDRAPASGHRTFAP